MPLLLIAMASELLCFSLAAIPEIPAMFDSRLEDMQSALAGKEDIQLLTHSFNILKEGQQQ